MSNDVSPTINEVAFLRQLDAGVPFDGAATTAGAKVAFSCILNGWVDRGSITVRGKAMIKPVVTIVPALPPNRPAPEGVEPK